MMFRSQAKAILDGLDLLIARTLVPTLREQSGILAFVFHSLFATSEEARSGLLDPQQAITESIFREFIAYFKERHYEFISAKDVESDSLPPGKYIFLTFDDGYRNNLRALPVLEEFKVPAV